MIASLIKDVRYALRQLRKFPGFTLTAVLTLAIGIGASASIFTIFDQVLLRMLPVADPSRLVQLHNTGTWQGGLSIDGGDGNDFFSYPAYKDIRDYNHVFSSVLSSKGVSSAIGLMEKPEMLNAELVSGNYFQVLGLQASQGRLLQDGDDQKSASPVAVLSYDYWKTHCAANPAVINQTVSVGGNRFVIVGASVLPVWHATHVEPAETLRAE